MQLYQKERNYEKLVFGDYDDLQSLNVASFLLIIEHYLEKAKAAYAGKWSKDKPDWLLACKEMIQDDKTAPVGAYEELIKIFALAGSALEAYTNIDPNKWRQNASEDMKKWTTTCEGE
jgi:hypothetical protein